MPRRPFPGFWRAAVAAVLTATLAAGCEMATLQNEGPPTPTRLTFSTEPEGAFAGQPISPGVAVTVLDSQGDTAYSSSASIQLEILTGTGSSAAKLNGTTQMAAVNGTANFSGVSIDSAGVGYRLVAVATGLGTAVSDSFDVIAIAGPVPAGVPAPAASSPAPRAPQPH